MNIFDAHCDTLYEVTFNNHKLYKNTLNIDLARMEKYGGYTQFFAAWVENRDNAAEKFIEMSDKLDTELERNNLKKSLCYADIKSAHRLGRPAVFFTLEGAYMVEKEEDIDFLYAHGVRCIALTWNSANKLAGGVDSDEGLSDLGKACVHRMQELGIIVDVSHLNERSFWDVAKIAKKPIIASHSNAKAVCPHKRNLTDEQFLEICRSGGCVGINFYSKFLRGESAALDDIAEHIRHFKKLGGIDCIGFGSDFDGVDSLPDGVTDIRDMKKIVHKLEKSGFSANEIDKITHLNFERVVKNGVG